MKFNPGMKDENGKDISVNSSQGGSLYEQKSPDYSTAGSFEQNDPLSKYEKGVDKAINTVNTVYSAGRRIAYVLMGILFFFVGAGLVVWGYLNVKHKIDGSVYVKAEATVISMREVPATQEAGETWTPTLKFRDKNGVEHTFESNVSSDPPAYSIGEKVEILYPEGKPEQAFINSFMEKWFTPIMLALAGLVMFIVSIWMIFTAFRREKPSKNFSSSNQGSSAYVSIG